MKVVRDITITNREDKIVAKIYFDKKGNVHCDSWIKLKGWGKGKAK